MLKIIWVSLFMISLRIVVYNKNCWLNYQMGLPWWLSGKESACQYRKCRFNPWVEKVPWRTKWLLIPVLLPGKSHRGPWWATVHGVAKEFGHDQATKQQLLPNEKIQKINALISFSQTTRIIVDQSKSSLLLEQEST